MLNNIIKKIHWPIAIILTTAFLLRVAMILRIGPFFFDEMFSFTYSQQPWILSIKYWLWETNPPLHMIFEKLWFYIFPANEFFARLPSAIFGTANVWMIWILGKNIFNKKVAILSAALLALTPYQIFQSAINRTYALLILLSLISVYYFFKIFLAKNNINKYGLIFTLVNTLLVLTHITSLYIIFTQILIVIWQRKDYKKWLRLNLVPIIFLIGWFLSSIIFKINTDTLSGAWFLHITNNFRSAIEIFQLLLTAPGNHIFGIGTIFIFFITFLFTIYKQTKKGVLNKKLLYIFIFAFLPITTALSLNIINIKFFVISTPFAILILAYSINYITKNTIIKLLLIFSNIISVLYIFLYINTGNEWLQLNKIIKQQYNPNKKQLLIYNNFIYRDLFARYYQGKIKTRPYFNYAIDYDEAIIKNNYILKKEKKETIGNWFDKNKLEQYEQIILFHHNQRGVDLPTTLLEKNYLIKSTKKLIGDGSPTIIIYEKNK